MTSTFPIPLSYLNRRVHVILCDIAPDIVIKLQSLSPSLGRVWTENADGITVFTPELSVRDITDKTDIDAGRAENTYIIKIDRSYTISYSGIEILKICTLYEQAMFVCNGSTMECSTMFGMCGQMIL
jgi:metal-dependent HD superfamily phosphatase/phosphodiesterase